MATLKPYTPFNMETFMERTALLPRVIAETVLLHEVPALHAEYWPWFIDHAEKRTLHCYNANRTFRNALNRSGDRGRQVLYAFVQHWLKAYRLGPRKYEQRHPHTGYASCN